MTSGTAIGLATAGWRLIDDGRFSLDALAGLRGWPLNTRIDVQVFPIVLSYRKQEGWIDGVGYGFSPTWPAFAGCRALKLDYQRGNFVYDALQHGPVPGVNVPF